MTDIRIEIKGLDRFKEQIRQAPQKAAELLADAIGRTLVELENSGKKEAPVNARGGGGNLRQNIRASRTGKLRGVVVASAPYAVYVHEGTKPHVIRPRAKKALSFEWARGGYQAGQVGGGIAFVRPGLTKNRRIKYHGSVVLGMVRHPGTKANPFFIRAIERSAARIDAFFEKALEDLMYFIEKP